jgi:hypothetical protein
VDVGSDGPRSPKPSHSSRGAKNSFREFHAFLARLLDVPELEMSDDDAARFTEAYREVRRHFPVPSVDPKWVALGTFAYVAYGVYAPRVAAVAQKKRGKPGSRGTVSAVGSPAAASATLTPDMPSTGDWFAGTA